MSSQAAQISGGKPFGGQPVAGPEAEVQLLQLDRLVVQPLATTGYRTLLGCHGALVGRPLPQVPLPLPPTTRCGPTGPRPMNGARRQ